MESVKIIIDDKSGVCGGVKRAISMIEERLSNTDESTRVFVNGELLHNRLEMERLQSLGLHVEEEIEKIKDSCLFFRAHGVGKEAFSIAADNNNKIIDATCPKVLRSQQIIEKYYEKGYQIIIIGKKMHPEVKGLLGHCNNEGLCILSENDCQSIDFNKETLIIAQTTVSRKRYEMLISHIKDCFKSTLKIPDTLCSFVENRERELESFAKMCDAIIFIGGSNSSNTKVMFTKIKEINPNSYLIENPDEINSEWLAGLDSVGISGSASTPIWQIKQVKDKIESFKKSNE